MKTQPLPLEQIFRAPPQNWLVADTQSNRAPAEQCLIAAENDLQIIALWLAQFSSKPNTLRAYTRDIARFYNWLVLLRQKSLASVTPKDLRLYEGFLANPPQEWCETRGTDQNTKTWFPFKGPMQAGSRKTTLHGVASCFTYMANARYLISNPFQGWDAQRKTTLNQLRASKTLGLSDLKLLVRALEMHADAAGEVSQFQELRAERELFIVRFLANTGLRREELALARMSDIQEISDDSTHGTYQLLRVRGNGSLLDAPSGQLVTGDRLVALNSPALEAIARFQDMASAEGLDGDRLIVPRIRRPSGKGNQNSSTPVTGQMIYYIVCDALRHASEFYEAIDLGLAERLRAATPHSFRNAFAVILRELGAEPEFIQTQLGCASMQTVMSKFSDREQLSLPDVLSRLSI